MAYFIRTYNNGLGFIRKIGVMPPFLPRMDIRNMQLNKGYAHTQ
jgi:hypothetical protein